MASDSLIQCCDSPRHCVLSDARVMSEKLLPLPDRCFERPEVDGDHVGLHDHPHNPHYKTVGRLGDVNDEG